MVDINNSILRFRHQTRSDTLANFNTRNEVLAVGEVVFVIDQNKIKIGDGVKPFQSLSFVTTDVAEVAQSVVPSIQVDTINEATTGEGVDVEGVILKDGDVTTGRQLTLIHSSIPTLDFKVTDGATTHNNIWLINSSNFFQIQTRTDNGSFVSNDYLVARDSAGATMHKWRISNVDKLVIDSSGNTLIKGLAKADQGISFDNGANTLDHYEEGTFTPEYSFVNTPTYTTQTGKYTRIGNILYFTLKIEVSSIDNTDVSNIHVTGLPFNASQAHQINASLNPVHSTILADYLQANDAVYFGQINSTTAILLQNGDRNHIKYNQIKSSGNLTITGWYFV